MPPEPYALEILRLLCTTLFFDMALLGEGPARLDGGLPTAQLSLYNCHAALFPALCACASGGGLDAAMGTPSTEAQGGSGVLALGRPEVLPRRLREAGVAELLFASTAAGAEQPRTWLALLRKPGSRAGPADAGLVAALWPHLLRALELNRHNALEARVAQTSAVGHALLGADYGIVACDPVFRAMFAREWPGLAVRGFPQRALLSLSESGRYDGRMLLLELSAGQDRPLCLSRAAAMAASLTPAESKVALRYARGNSSKEIAHELCVSENTVRTHLAHVFDKMGIHRKADLIRRLAPG